MRLDPETTTLIRGSGFIVIDDFEQNKWTIGGNKSGICVNDTILSNSEFD